MEINRNQITDRLRQRNSGARTTRARLSLYSALSVYDQHAFLSSRFVRFLLSRERAFSTSVATRIPASAPERDEETPSRARARARVRNRSRKRKEATEQDHPRFSRLTRPPNEIFSSITIGKRFARPR